VETAYHLLYLELLDFMLAEAAVLQTVANQDFLVMETTQPQTTVEQQVKQTLAVVVALAADKLVQEIGILAALVL
jgi:hypothetical protein